ncbi:MAG: ABC transporter permease [Alphaproteobacteria bacterium]|nr:ABC transporter permease [Alphaproteobacteria bacterium]
MTDYLLRRVLDSLLVLLVMSFVIYGLIGLMPGDPVDLMISSDPELTPEDAARLKQLYGLDRPLVARYGSWLGAAMQGDLGYSRIHARPVLEVLVRPLTVSVVLIGLSLAISLLVAVPAGVYAARRPGGWMDGLINLFCFAGISVPPFWLALLLMMLFAVRLGWLPAGGTPMGGNVGVTDELRYLALPVTSLTLLTIGGFIRFMRAAMIEALRADYIRTARAMGLSEARVLWGHAWRNAALPVVTVVALSFGNLVSGALITETVFAYPGMGKAIYDAILGNDYNLAVTALLFATAMTLAGNLTADMAYGWLDPRIRYD